MTRKPSSPLKWIALLTSFLAAMCCICLGLAYIAGAANNQATTAPIPLSTTTSTPPPVAKLAIIPATLPATQIPQPTNPRPAPTSYSILPTPIALPLLPQNPAPLLFHFINVGQGDSTLIQTPGGQNILIDGGETNTGILQYIQSLNIQRIDLMIATHPHSDHIGGLVQVLQALPVTKVITSGDPHTTSTYEHFLDGIAAAHAEYLELKRGDNFSIDGLTFHVLNPLTNANADLNENSLVLQFTYGLTTFLMMGDSGADTETALLSSGLPLKATILKVGHHGSTSGTTPAFLNAVKPEIALYSAGINNSYHHPAPRTITALTAAGATIYGTDKNGTITIEVTANGYTIHTNTAIAQPTAPAPIAAGGITITSVTSPVFRGGNATLKAAATPGAACTITVYYKSGPSKASGLAPQTADASGQLTWTWKVGNTTTPGNWRIVVTCADLTQETNFTVQ